MKKENRPKLSQICRLWDFSKGLKNEFETAMVDEPSVVEPLKFYCISGCVYVTQTIMESTCSAYASTRRSIHLIYLPENIFTVTETTNATENNKCYRNQ